MGNAIRVSPQAMIVVDMQCSVVVDMQWQAFVSETKCCSI